MITEKTSTPIGSSLLRPMGYRYWSCRLINQVVIHTMAVDRKSRIASTKLANTETDGTVRTTASLLARRIALAAKLM
jgi:hypothetical protein